MQLSLALVVAMGVLGFACGSDSDTIDGGIFARNMRTQTPYSSCHHNPTVPCPVGCPSGVCYRCNEGICTCTATSSKCGYCGDKFCRDW